MAKTSRWFSWNEQADLRLCEWAASRMILEWNFYEEELDVDACKKLNFKEFSGLKMCYLSHSWKNWENCHVLLIVQRSFHEWYSHQTHFVKSPDDGLADSLHMVVNWPIDTSLKGVANCLSDSGYFDSIAQVSEDVQAMAELAGDYGLKVLGNRCSSFAEKYSSPPMCYVEILSDDVGKQQEALTLFRRDWQRLKALEASTVPCAQDLARDLRTTFDTTVRFMAQVFEAHSWTICDEGLELMSLLAGGFSDTKIIEDAHQSLRVATGPKATKSLAGTCVQEVLQASRILEERRVAHPCQITYQNFLDSWHRTRPDFHRNDFRASKHCLPKPFSKILGPKTWPTLSEIELSRSSSGWRFLRKYVNENLSQHGVKLQDFILETNARLFSS